MSQLTPAQLHAVQATGNVLVEAGAGTGKTRTLVERCLARMIAAQDRIALQEMVIVTFTEAAATEMRQRLRATLEKQCREHPEDSWLAEQFAAVDIAWISTLHSFCLRLAREHFHELGLDPQFTVLAQEQANILEQEVLDTLFTHPDHAKRLGALQRWSRERGRGGLQKLRGYIRRLFHYTQTLSNPGAWFARELGYLEAAEPENWIRHWPEELDGWRSHWRDALEPLRGHGFAACQEQLDSLAPGDSPQATRLALERILAALPPKKGLPAPAQKRLETLSEEIAFLRSLLPEEAGPGAPVVWQALREDWEWIRHPMADLIHLTRAFIAEFARRKQELGGVDFHDLEQIALALLWDPQTQSPRPIAERWRERARLLFIDEYQDINEAQDSILQCLGRPDARGNRFLVGDIKQSIYRFRLANPRIFQRYARLWREAPTQGQVLRLTENFRSHPAILEFVNRFFTGLMREKIGGVDYDEKTALRSGDPDSPRFGGVTPAGAPAGAPRVALRLLAGEESPEEPDAGAEDPIAELSRHELEARMIGTILLEMRQRPDAVWDEHEHRLRPVDWRDMAVLLRSPKDKAEVFAKEFGRLGIPLAAARGGFYEAIEASDWINLLRLLDNPFQDLPLLAVLRSPLAGFTADELVAVRLASRAGALWTALRAVSQTAGAGPARDKAAGFLERHRRWRQMARTIALSECLSLMLDETLYETWLATQSRPQQRLANIRRLLNLTRQFDQFQRQGLFRFLRFVEAQIDAGIDLEPAPAETANAVRLLSIHQSKGLEFPVVVVADLSKPFNESDFRSPIMLDEVLGLCPLVKPPHSGQKYPSFAHWFARRRQRAEMVGEEMRLLYVAMTRARDYLILSGAATGKRMTQWAGDSRPPAGGPDPAQARCFLDWVGPKCAAIVPDGELSTPGETDGFAWRVVAPGPLRNSATAAASNEGDLSPAVEPLPNADLAALADRLSWRYPFARPTSEPAKTSVSAWRRRVLQETDAESYPLFTEMPLSEPPSAREPVRETRLGAADVGTAHHAFMEWVRLDKTGGLPELEAEAARLVATGVLSPEERAALDLRAIAAFWASELGRRVLSNGQHVRRELPFTARFTAAELSAWLTGNSGAATGDPADFIVVQGVVDLAVVREDEIWVVDYKTDHVGPEGVAQKARAYAPQLALYAEALARIYRRPATQCWLYFLALDRAVRLDLSAK